MKRHLKLWLFVCLVSAFEIANGDPKRPVDQFDGVCSGTTRGYHTLLTGTEDGYYYKVGRAIALVADEQCKKGPSSCLYICAQPSHQTLDNFKRLAHHEADFAIVQGDVAHDAWFGHPLSEKRREVIDGQHVKLVTPLYVEGVHILLRPHLNITSLEGLRGKRVWLGPSESSTEYTARRVLKSAGLNPNPPGCEGLDHESPELDAIVVTCISGTKEPRKFTFKTAVAALKDARIDALFKVGPVPSKDIQDTLLPASAGPVEASKSATEPGLGSDFQLLPFDYSLAHQYAQSGNGGYVEKLIQPYAYQQNPSTLTIGVPAFLLTSLEANQDVARLAQVIRENRASIDARVVDLIKKEERESNIKQGHKHPFSLDLVNISFPNVPLHDLAVPPQHVWQKWPWLLLSVALSFAAVFPLLWWIMAHRRRKIAFNLFLFVSALRDSMMIALALSFLSCCAGAVLLKHYEQIVNENFQSFPLAVWSTVQQSIPFFQSRMITPDGESAALKVAWLIRGVFIFGIVRIFKKKYERRFQEWMQSEQLKKQVRKGIAVPIRTEIPSERIDQQGAD